VFFIEQHFHIARIDVQTTALIANNEFMIGDSAASARSR
jgi:hypothetical protein